MWYQAAGSRNNPLVTKLRTSSSVVLYSRRISRSLELNCKESCPPLLGAAAQIVLLPVDNSLLFIQQLTVATPQPTQKKNNTCN